MPCAGLLCAFFPPMIPRGDKTTAAKAPMRSAPKSTAPRRTAPTGARHPCCRPRWGPHGQSRVGTPPRRTREDGRDGVVYAAVGWKPQLRLRDWHIGDPFILWACSPSPWLLRGSLLLFEGSPQPPPPLLLSCNCVTGGKMQKGDVLDIQFGRKSTLGPEELQHDGCHLGDDHPPSRR